MWRKALLSLFAGAFCYVIGSIFAVPAKTFLDTSEPATLIVLQVDEKYNNDGDRMYRPVFGLVTEMRPRPEYTGSIWTRPKPHQSGDIVEGRYNAETGEMRSTHMVNRTFRAGRIAQAIGFVLFAQGVLMLFGFPEIIPVRFRGRRRYRRW
ncbi:hypothetical protein [Roseobacter sp. CCS2]|uniref:hypothetical protein n=1 Tax=Roseobacter sp. CCS2 TaxID=391593 RepID=UPI0000F3F578|nr:hypothetical protein [Roseobacter sp. CCS2]EBA10794.1 hypothetical protein RCCS2_11327 [Roseobacter sp. CCS2]